MAIEACMVYVGSRYRNFVFCGSVTVIGTGHRVQWGTGDIKEILVKWGNR